jgi:hypothetical protein
MIAHNKMILLNSDSYRSPDRRLPFQLQIGAAFLLNVKAISMPSTYRNISRHSVRFSSAHFTRCFNKYS